MTGNAAERFTAFDTSHQVALLLLVAGAFALVWVGRATRQGDPGDRIGKGLAVAVLLLTLPLQVIYFTPDYWDLYTTLPLQLCDVAAWVSAYALWTHRAWAVGLTYYWGLTLATQAIITPDLASTFPDLVFILFWGMHLMIVWAAVYLTWGLGLTPSWRSYRIALCATAAWAVTIYAFNVTVGTNYGYLNAKPQTASILDLLGDWPWYVLAEISLVIAVWALATWPWVSPARRRGRASDVQHRS